MVKVDKLSPAKLILGAAFFLALTGNVAFFRNAVVVYPPGQGNLLFVLSLMVLLASVNTLLLSLLCWGRVFRPLLALILLASAAAAYFMDSYNVIIDSSMIDNIVKTDAEESLDLLSWRLFAYLMLLGVLPSAFVWRVKLQSRSRIHALRSRLAMIVISIVMAAAMVALLPDHYASFFREHKSLRFYTNPATWVHSAAGFVSEKLGGPPPTLREIGLDTIIDPGDAERELVIVVVGEAARADHFSLNGYERETNPLLAAEEVLSFDNVWSCGTSTAYSVPCMFSILDENDFDKEEAEYTENVLDILYRAGVNVLWLDNNSDSKGVAERVPHQSYKHEDTNAICDVECRDEGMLLHLQEYIDSHPEGDILIVLHQMGNHGPAYYKRYPATFEKFSPVCQTPELQDCSQQEIINAYDNALLYTDYFLSRVIALLKDNSSFEAGMLYLSDHGESLGENSLYLHGLPRAIAPDGQVHVPMIMWAGPGLVHEFNMDKLKEGRHQRLSHDSLFHVLLGIFETESALYEPALDFIEHNEDED